MRKSVYYPTRQSSSSASLPKSSAIPNFCLGASAHASKSAPRGCRCRGFDQRAPDVRERFTSRVTPGPATAYRCRLDRGAVPLPQQPLDVCTGPGRLPGWLFCRFRIQIAPPAKDDRGPVQRGGAPQARSRSLWASDARRPRSARALRLNCWPLAQKCKMSHGDQQRRHTRNRKGPKKRRLHRRAGRSRALSRRLTISIYPIWRPRRIWQSCEPNCERRSPS